MAVMIPEKDMPEGCRTCRFFKKHTSGLSLDYSYSCMYGAINIPMPWIKQETERAADCPLKLVEGLIERIGIKKIETTKTGTSWEDLL